MVSRDFLVALERDIHNSLGYDVKVAVLRGNIESPALTIREQENLLAVSNERRRLSWLRGRCVLKILLGELGADPDTSLLSFPHNQYSLSHTADVAVAVARLHSAEANGIGVDLEKLRDIKSGAERFFLSDAERGFLRGLSEVSRTDNLIRLWTVKEAIFKSAMLAQDGVLKNYCTADPRLLQGEATHSGHSRLDCSQKFRYVSRSMEDFWLSVAVPENT